ncbi:hypothetical protein KsCSTR_46880 [Candidatus Kuenenia stuttgartiensis]|uniref:Uncharacterized protein n=1 Tax=Kuenenia stuttgartiensis TaxID=174633 RepID=A0A6G7GWW3_KUEST|nr:hypothetical protein KsCSTR_46880 [Candidatus Kuenenia stuttgartiensis]
MRMGLVPTVKYGTLKYWRKEAFLSLNYHYSDIFISELQQFFGKKQPCQS